MYGHGHGVGAPAHYGGQGMMMHGQGGGPPQQQPPPAQFDHHSSGKPDPANADRTIFIGNLPWDTTDQQLAAHCSQAGQVVHVRLATDHQTGRGKGYAFVEYRSMGEATSAIRNLNQVDFRGRALRVDYSDPNHRGKTQQQVEAMAAAARGELPHPPPPLPPAHMMQQQMHQQQQPMMRGGPPTPYGLGANAVPLAAHREQEDLRKVFSSGPQQDVHMMDRAPPAVGASSSSSGAGAASLAAGSSSLLLTVGSLAPTVQPGAQPYGTDTIAKLVTSLTKPQLLEILSEMKKFAAANPEGAKQLLFDSPQVAQTLLHIMIMFGLVRPQDVAMIQTATRPTASDAPLVGLPQQQQQQQQQAYQHQQQLQQQPQSFISPSPPSLAHQAYPPPSSMALLPPPPLPSQPLAVAAASAAPLPPPAAASQLTEQDAFMLQTIRELAPDQIQQLPQEVQEKIRLLQQQLARDQR